MTKDQKLSELVQRAVANLKTLAPPVGMSDPDAISAYYAIFQGPARWKAEVLTRPEPVVLSGKAKPGFKRGRAGF